MKTSNLSIGLALSQSTLYPPLLGTAPAIVGFTTEVPPGGDIEFSLVANGAPGIPARIELRPGSSAGGTLWVLPGFVAGYDGTWPVQLMLQASRQGEVIDTATLWLHDTRTMKVDRIAGELVPNPVHVTDTDAQLVLVRAKFYDAAGVELPRDEVPWSVTLPDNPPGLVVDAATIRVAPGTVPGEVDVRIEAANDKSQALILTLLPALDIGLELSKYDLYPPHRGTPAAVAIHTSLPPDSGVSFNYRLNGEDGRHPGIFLDSVGGYWGLMFYRDFLDAYSGPWPAEITVHAILNGQLAGRRTLYLHDTRTMVCTRVDMVLNPSDTVAIPSEGVVHVIGAPRFYDAHDVRLPHEELDWGAVLENEPIPGITRTSTCWKFTRTHSRVGIVSAFWDPATSALPDS